MFYTNLFQNLFFSLLLIFYSAKNLNFIKHVKKLFKFYQLDFEPGINIQSIIFIFQYIGCEVNFITIDSVRLN